MKMNPANLTLYQRAFTQEQSDIATSDFMNMILNSLFPVRKNPTKIKRDPLLSLLKEFYEENYFLNLK